MCRRGYIVLHHFCHSERSEESIPITNLHCERAYNFNFAITTYNLIQIYNLLMDYKKQARRAYYPKFIALILGLQS
jgi:hypothetical protein